LERSLECNGVSQHKEILGYKGIFGSACYGAAYYEHEDERYCIIHFPHENKEVDFKNAVQSKLERNDFRFAGAYFPKFAGFRGTTFTEVADFRGATFTEEAVFDGATFSKRAHFYGATFKERAAFYSLQLLSQAAFDFRDATIEKPERISFHTTFLRPNWFVDVDAQKFDFSDVEWFRTSTGERLTLEDEITALERRDIRPPESLRKLTKACRRLMNNAEDNRDYPTANEFHYWSMEAMRKEGWRSLGFIATLYWALSGYGERPRRAFWVLVAIWLTFAALYLLLADTAPFWVFSASDVWQGIDYTRQALVYSLAALARLNPEPKPEELGWFQTLVTVEGILGPLQIALFLLAVRRRVMR
jgi:hypothetical protein